MTVEKMMGLLATMPPTAEVKICATDGTDVANISRVVWTKRMMSREPDYVGVYLGPLEKGE